MPRISPRLRQPVHSDTNPWSPLLRYFHNPFYAWQAVQLPLSGDVTQAINPWSWTFGSATSQIGLAMPAPCRIGASIMLGFQPFKGAPVHPLGLVAFRICDTRLPTKSIPDPACPTHRTIIRGFSLTGIGQPVAMATSEDAGAADIQQGHTPPAAHRGAEEPRSRPAIVARCASQPHRVFHRLPLPAPAPVLIGQGQPIRGRPHLNGCDGFTVAGPVQAEGAARRQ